MCEKSLITEMKINYKEEEELGRYIPITVKYSLLYY